MGVASLIAYLNGVRAEIRKISWITGRDFFLTTSMVLVVIAVCAVMFLGIDLVVSNLIAILLG